jgi:single-stranded-DNA-specific exonuclease
LEQKESTLSKKRWVAKEIPEKERIEQLSKSLNVNTTFGTLLLQRGINTFDEAKYFFRPSLLHLHDPFLMKDMQKAVERIQTAISKQEKILVYGDYDVDGTTAVATVYSFFHEFYPNVDFYIPDRYAEGYGVSFKGIDWAAENGFSVIIALDCGIKSIAHVDYALSKNIEFIICDHHLPGEEVPKATAILNPKQSDCSYPFKELSGCGIGFKLIQAFSSATQMADMHMERYLDLAAVSIAADIVPIVDENRVLAHFGLKKLIEDPNYGLQALLEYSSKKPELTISDVVFSIGPRINAAGRIADAKDSVRLMLAPSMEKAREFAGQINTHNEERRNFDTNITEEALSLIENSTEMLSRRSTVVYNPEWHKGVIGIVASRLIEKYHRPTVVLTRSNGVATGSARSVPGFDLYKAIEACSDLLEQFGGHTHAAGLTLKVENVEPFMEKFERIVAETIEEKCLTPEVEYDIELPLKSINPRFMNILKQFAPFGPGNMNPVFMTRNVWDNGYGAIVGENHLRLSLLQDAHGKPLKGIAFGQAHHYDRIATGVSFDICYTIEENHFNDTTTLQLNIKDIKFADER